MAPIAAIATRRSCPARRSPLTRPRLFVNANLPGPNGSFEYLVQEFAAGANGNPRPIATLHGADAALNGRPAWASPRHDRATAGQQLFGAGSVTQYNVPATGDLKPAPAPVANGAVSDPTGLLVVASPTLPPSSQLPGMAGTVLADPDRRRGPRAVQLGDRIGPVAHRFGAIFRARPARRGTGPLGLKQSCLGHGGFCEPRAAPSAITARHAGMRLTARSARDADRAAASEFTECDWSGTARETVMGRLCVLIASGPCSRSAGTHLKIDV